MMAETPDILIEAAEGDLAEGLPVTGDPLTPPEDIEVGIETPEADAAEQTLPVSFDEEDDEYR